MRDILLQVNSHPEPAPDWAIEQSASIAARLRATLSLGVCQVHIPQASNWLANALLKIDRVIADENRKSAGNADALAEKFARLIAPDLNGGVFVVECPATISHWQFAVKARTYDLTVIPVYGHVQSAHFAEGVVFETGRPVLLLPEVQTREPKFDRIAVAWDGSRVAARALADAMPLLRQASSVSLVQITGEKDLSRTASLADLLRHLRLHGINAETVEKAIEDGDAGRTLQSHCLRDGRDLLVTGAFGHSRAREFVLGGVTRSILDDTKLPVLMSH
jgi:nucleotide-binding universal stress UspA family protein